MRQFRDREVTYGPAIHPLVKRIATLRRKHRVSWADLSKRSGVSLYLLQSWRNGKHRPNVDDLDAVFGVFEMKMTVAPLGVGRPRKTEMSDA